MKEQSLPFAITISREIGSGGSYLGHRIASRLGILYLDHEILLQAATLLESSEEILKPLDERVTPFWQTLFQSLAYISPETPYMPTYTRIPSDSELYKTESDIIKKVAVEKSAVIVGRGGFRVLCGHPRHLSILLYGNPNFRLKRIEEIFNVSPKEARKILVEIDQSREQYHRVFMKKEWMDARQYNLCIDTSVLGLEAAEEVIMGCICSRFGIGCI